MPLRFTYDETPMQASNQSSVVLYFKYQQLTCQVFKLQTRQELTKKTPTYDKKQVQLLVLPLP